jgi:hypothetical protein
VRQRACGHGERRTAVLRRWRAALEHMPGRRSDRRRPGQSGAWLGLLLRSTLPAFASCLRLLRPYGSGSCPYSSVQHILAVPRSLLDVVYATSETSACLCCRDARCLCPTGLRTGGTQSPCVLLTMYPHAGRVKHPPAVSRGGFPPDRRVAGQRQPPGRLLFGQARRPGDVTGDTPSWFTG